MMKPAEEDARPEIDADERDAADRETCGNPALRRSGLLSDPSVTGSARSRT